MLPLDHDKIAKVLGSTYTSLPTGATKSPQALVDFYLKETRKRTKKSPKRKKKK